MDFEPVNLDHAVQSAVFSVAFDGVVPLASVQALGRRGELISELPAVQSPEGLELAMTPGAAAPSPKRVVGIQLAHLRPDGTPAWALRMMGNELAAECTRYTRWAKVWETAQRYLNTGIEVVGRSERPRKIAVIGHAIADQFVANREDYDLRGLLRENRYLANNSFVAGPAWHNHVGWFESPVSKSQAWLNQLNIEGLREPKTGNWIVQITHNQQIRFDGGIGIPNLESRLDDSMATLHANNKRVLYEILAPGMADKIGLVKNEQ